MNVTNVESLLVRAARGGISLVLALAGCSSDAASVGDADAAQTGETSDGGSSTPDAGGPDRGGVADANRRDAVADGDAPVLTDASSDGMSYLPGGVRYVGRVDAHDATAVVFAWQGAGVLAIVGGDSISVKLRTEGTDTVFFQAVVDGKPGDRFEVKSGSDQTVSLGAGLGDKDHQVELYRETEGRYGKSTFLGFVDGTVRGAPASNGRLVEVVGDSISAGYGNLGKEPHPNWVANPACHWTAANSSWYDTYAAVAGHALGAEVSTVAMSGWGMVRDNQNNTSNVLPSVYDDEVGTASTPVWQFDPKASVVVINLGTNDWANGDPGTPYETAYLDFIGKVRTHYPDAWIFLTIGPMLNQPALGQVIDHLTKVVNASGDAKVTTFDFGTQDLGSDGSIPSGCDWHPSVSEHQRMAGVLEAQLKDKLGW